MGIYCLVFPRRVIWRPSTDEAYKVTIYINMSAIVLCHKDMHSLVATAAQNSRFELPALSARNIYIYIAISVASRRHKHDSELTRMPSCCFICIWRHLHTARNKSLLATSMLLQCSRD